MRVTVDRAKCQGHGVCVMKSPHLFDLGVADGLSYPLVETVSGELETAARVAEVNCPERAISLIN
jgi:ferredoxin